MHFIYLFSPFLTLSLSFFLFLCVDFAVHNEHGCGNVSFCLLTFSLLSPKFRLFFSSSAVALVSLVRSPILFGCSFSLSSVLC